MRERRRCRSEGRTGHNPSIEETTMKHKALARSTRLPGYLAALLLVAAGHASADWSANIGYSIEYIFRGITQKTSSASGGLDFERDGFLCRHLGRGRRRRTRGRRLLRVWRRDRIPVLQRRLHRLFLHGRFRRHLPGGQSWFRFCECDFRRRHRAIRQLRRTDTGTTPSRRSASNTKASMPRSAASRRTSTASTSNSATARPSATSISAWHSSCPTTT